MRKLAFTFCSVAGSAFATITAHAAVTISTDPTTNMSCTASLCQPESAGDAILNVTDLQNLLAASSVEVTTSAHGIQTDDIVVAAPLGWTSSSVLTLTAHHNLTIDQPMTVMGTAGLTLNYNAKHSDLSFGAAANVTFWDTNSALTVNGTSYVLVSDIATLAHAIKKNLYCACALAKSYDASVDGAYKSTPIPSFSGTFEGLGNTISNLTIRDAKSTYVGLFGGEGAYRDIGLVNVNVTSAFAGANVGALVGYTPGTIIGSYSTGSVTGGSGVNIGGLVGSAGNISDSYSTATVIAGDDINTAGGLAGGALAIRRSHAIGSVTTGSGGYAAGGLVATTDGAITDSYATGSVTTNLGGGYTGGLIGYAGEHEGTPIVASFATGDVRDSGVNSTLGGLVGNLSASQIVNSYATGSVTATGGGNAIGGLIGSGNSLPNNPNSTSYAIGAVSAVDTGFIGGFDGYVNEGSASFDHCYWDVETSGQSQGLGGPGGGVGGVTGLTSKQLQKKLPRGFSSNVWTIDPNGVINGGFPYLIANPPPQ